MRGFLRPRARPGIKNMPKCPSFLIAGTFYFDKISSINYHWVSKRSKVYLLDTDQAIQHG